MKIEAQASCRDIQTELWSCWPREDDMPPRVRAHLPGCRACREELAALRAFSRRDAPQGPRPAAWGEIIPASRWALTAASTRKALNAPAPPRPLAWAPALGFAVAATLLLWQVAPRERRERPAALLPVPVEAVENIELLENLDVVENLNVLQNWAALRQDESGPAESQAP